MSLIFVTYVSLIFVIAILSRRRRKTWFATRYVNILCGIKKYNVGSPFGAQKILKKKV